MYLFDLLKEPAFGFVESLYHFVSNLLIFDLEFDYFLLLLLLGMFVSFYSRAFSCAVKLLVEDVFNFFNEGT